MAEAAQDRGQGAARRPPGGGPPVRLRRARRFVRRIAWAVIAAGAGFVGVTVLFAVFAAMSPRPITLPVWMLAEAEARLTAALAARGGDGLNVTIGGVAADVTAGAPRLRLTDLRLNAADGTARLALPEVSARFDPAALAAGRLRLADVAVSGARIRLMRDADGRFDIALGEGAAALSAAAVSQALREMFAQPELADAQRLAVEGAVLTLDDRRSGRVWTAGEGRITLDRAAGDVLEIAAGLALAAPATGRAQVGIRLAPDGSARVTTAVEGLAARDIAAQAPALGWLAVIDAPLSGSLDARFDPAGALAALEGALTVAAGALRPEGGAAPVAFDSAGLRLAYDPAAGRIAVSDLAVSGAALRLTADGHVTLAEVADGRPGAFIGQFRFGEVTVDPAGTFAEPLRLVGGAVDLRLRTAPFGLDIGQLALLGDGWRLDAAGRIGADAAGWRAALDARLDAIPAAGLLQLWPVWLVPGTRAWLLANVREGTLRDLRAAYRQAPGGDPVLTLGYDYDGAAVRLLPGLPPVAGAAGHATMIDNTYTLVLDRGTVTPPEGGAIDVAGSVFRIGDIRVVPGIAEVTVAATGAVRAVLSLIDQPPFGFVTAAGMTPAIADGTARLQARATMPLIPRLTPQDVDFSLSGTLDGVSSTAILPGRTLAARQLQVAADNGGISIGGPLTLDDVPAEAVWRQPFGQPGAPPPPATVTGWVALDPAFARAFLPGLPEGWMTGDGRGDLSVAIPRGEPARVRLTSDLGRVALNVPALGWAKPADVRGRLAVAMRAGSDPAIERIEIEVPGLAATGSARMAPDGAFQRLTLDRLRLGDWLDTALTLDAGGALTLTGGSADLRGLLSGPGAAAGAGGGAGAAPAVALALDRVQVADGLALTGVTGRFDGRGGLNGRFAARVNGAAPVTLQVEAGGSGPAVRVTADDAGAVLAAAGLFDRARGGALDLVLTPRAGGFDGRAVLGGFRVFGMSVLADLLNAVSIVGLIDQLSGGGLPFSRAEAGLRLDGARLSIVDGVAEGPSFGVTLQGSYDTAADRLEMDGVISPLYIVNGIGQVLTRPGEGVFGFTYRISGPAAAPRVSVNPLSVLAPGFLRNAFRAGDGDAAQPAPPPDDRPVGGDR